MSGTESSIDEDPFADNCTKMDSFLDCIDTILEERNLAGE